MGPAVPSSGTGVCKNYSIEYNNSMIVRYKYLTKSNDRISCITHTGESDSDVAPGVEGLVATDVLP